ncbi:uncharacterized protein LOC127735651 [Mytilus californianus]|uniref:uncharacterized protein LOC127735651 n=1 Tax=Mytilus californianus TaxID=6549 RepID=UPI002246336C|nr:uncharacterized protein LOC127735651 [Mytilus californianus]
MKSVLVLSITQILLVDMLQSLAIMHVCPERALWRRRAEVFCANKTQYHCLFDTFHRQYSEYCLSSKPYKSGLRIVYSGNLHAEDCQNPRYSPSPVLSNDSAECNLLKSNCKEEGQVIADNATSNTDRTCRCDYTKGYNYIIKPIDPCKCSPVKEDCSCYSNTCPVGYTLNQDYHCVNRTLKTFNCPLLEKSRYGVLSSSNSSPEEFDLNETGPLMNRHTHLTYYIPLCLMLSVTVTIFVFALWCRNRMEYSACFRIDMKKRTLSKQRENRDKLKTMTDIFRQITDMQCMQNYQPTKQINDMETELKGRSQSTLLILEGFSGSGKTQAVYYFCSKMRYSYSVIAKINARDNKSFIDSLKNLATNLRLSIQNQDENFCELLCTHIGNFLNHDRRRGCSYLFFIDNVMEINDHDPLSHVFSLKDKVKGLHIIVATVNSKIHTHFKTAPVVTFNGMETNEILDLFKNNQSVEVSNSEIKDLIRVIGNIPLVVDSAKQYILRREHTIKNYIEIFKDLTGIHAKEKFIAHEMNNRKSIIKSQLLPLKHIEEHLHELKQGDLWDIVGYLPYLQYSSVSKEVLEACYYHSCPTKDNESLGKVKIDILMDQFANFSVCHSEKKPVRRMIDIDEKFAESSFSYDILTFHELTMCVLNLIDNEKEADEKSTRRKRQLRIYFLLKMFCFEIDIDARTDVTLDRNIQFLPHAEKLLNELELPDENKDSPEVKFYLSYLHCAIGSTLLYQRNDVESAHKYLLKSRSLCLELVMNKTDFLVHEPPTENDIQQVLDTAFLLKFNQNFVLEFVKSKRRSESEKDVICDELDDMKLFKKEAEKTKEEFKYHYLNIDGLYEKLLKKKLALSVKDISETFVYELVQRILHNNSRAWNELRYITTDEATETLRKASHSEVVFSNSLCRLMKKKYKFKNVFVCLESDRSGRMLERWTQDTNPSYEVDDDIAFYEAMIQKKSNNYFDFGILKLSPRVNDRHIAMCKRILLWFLELRFTNQEKANAGTTFEYGKTFVEELQAQINQMQTQKYTWLTLPLLHIQCAKFLRLCSFPCDLIKAEHLFYKAVLLEESRGVAWSRFMWEGYVGALDCTKKSNNQLEENKLIEEVKQKLTGTNRKDLIEKLTETRMF